MVWWSIFLNLFVFIYSGWPLTCIVVLPSFRRAIPSSILSKNTCVLLLLVIRSMINIDAPCWSNFFWTSTRSALLNVTAVPGAPCQGWAAWRASRPRRWDFPKNRFNSSVRSVSPCEKNGKICYDDKNQHWLYRLKTIFHLIILMIQ